MWRASLQQYQKHRSYSNWDDKHYRPIFLDVPDDNFPHYGKVRLREGKRKFSRVSDLFEYAERFNLRMRRYLMRQANPDAMRAGTGKFVWNKSSLLHTFLWRGEKLRKPQNIVIPQSVQLADVSFYQGAIDWSKFTLDGVIIKAGQRNYPDPQFSNNWKNAKARGVPRGTYWFYDSRQAPKYQAALWASPIAADQGELLHCADYEENYGGPYAGPVNFRVFLEEFQRLSKLPDKRIAIYTGRPYWIAHSPTNLTELNWFGRFELWLAWYTSNPANVIIPKPWDNSRLVMWQWTSGGSGYAQGMQSAELDLNFYNGTHSDYEMRFGVISVPPNNGGTMNYVGKAKITATPNVRVRETYPLGQTIAAIQPGQDFTGDLLENNWMRVTSVGGRTILSLTGKAFGWSAAQYLDYQVVTPPPPATRKVTKVYAELVAGSTVTLHYDDGSTEVKTA